MSQTSHPAPVRYAIRQALDQEYQKFLVRQSNEARQARFKAGRAIGEDEDDAGAAPTAATGSGQSRAGDDAGTTRVSGPKRDFFGRMIAEAPSPVGVDGDGQVVKRTLTKEEGEAEGRRVWVTFHEGFSNAVRKPVTLDELLRSL